MNYLRPQIKAIHFPQIIRGSGPLTRLHVQVSGWGKLKVSTLEKQSSPFRQWIWWKTKIYELDVPKNQEITITFRNLFGSDQHRIQSPSNNLEFTLNKPSVPRVGALPKPQFNHIRAQVRSLKSIFLKSLSAKVLVPSIRILTPNMRLRRSLRQQHLSTYRFTAPPLKASINYQAIKFIPKSNKQREKGSLK
jgi:hypothetical protein